MTVVVLASLASFLGGIIAGSVATMALVGVGLNAKDREK